MRLQVAASTALLIISCSTTVFYFSLNQRYVVTRSTVLRPESVVLELRSSQRDVEVQSFDSIEPLSELNAKQSTSSRSNLKQSASGVVPVTKWENVPRQWRLPPPDRSTKRQYFVYQPSGGWGNQRYMLRWAIIAANAMGRTLVLPPVGAHVNFWWRFNKFRAEDLAGMHMVLDLNALSRAVANGIVVHNDTIDALRTNPAFFGGSDISWRIWRRPASFHKKGMSFSSATIHMNWAKVKADVVFWEKNSMWKCCGIRPAMNSWIDSHIIFSQHLKSLSIVLAKRLGEAYNAVHVRRGDHPSGERLTEARYYKRHHLELFSSELPLYIATDEKDSTWFSNWTRFSTKKFWYDLNEDGLLDRELSVFPERLHETVLGFVEQLICGNAVQWEGSTGSTFSAAISAIRARPTHRELVVSLPSRPPGKWW